jgi:hypothetical protein
MAPRASRALAVAATLALLGAGPSPPPARAAEDAAPAPPAWLSEVTLDGFLSTSYSYNFNRPASRTNQLRVFDLHENSFVLDEFELVAQKPVAKPRDSGFRVDLSFGSSVPPVTASAGLFRDESGKAGDLDVHQAFASWIAPLGSGLRLDLGKFITHHGYEVIEGYDGWNDNATRSFLFGFAIPFTHVGARASYAFSPRLAGMVMLVNGWDVAVDDNRSKSVGAQLALTPVAPLTIYLNAMYGPERVNDDADARTMLDLAAIWKATSRVTLGLNADDGREKNAVTPGETARWNGIAGYVRAAVAGPLSLALRAEYFADPDGARTATAQDLAEVTVTPELRLTPRLMVRGDLRVDHSSRDVFEKGNGHTDTQPTALLGVLYAF